MELLQAGIPWDVMEKADDWRIMLYWSVVVELKKIESDAVSDREEMQRSALRQRI